VQYLSKFDIIILLTPKEEVQMARGKFKMKRKRRRVLYSK